MKKHIFHLLVAVTLPGLTPLCAQVNLKSPGPVTTYIHVSPPVAYRSDYTAPITAFMINNIDTTGKVNWQSAEIYDFEKADSGYFVKVDVPDSLISNSRGLWCSAIMKTPDTKMPGTYHKTVQQYGGATLSKIKLILRSSPEGAESFLVPNRIWISKLANRNWEREDEVLDKFRVNTSSTNTYAYVDETVFVVVYRIGNKFKKVVHFTKPASIEKEQTVWVNFDH